MNERTGDVEKGKNIAPTLLLMSQAIVDWLDTCSGLWNSEWVLRTATELRDLCNKLIKGTPRE
jgi:hypothetical protein